MHFRHVPAFPMTDVVAMSVDGSLCLLQKQQTVEIWKIENDVPEFCVEIHKKVLLILGTLQY